MKPKKQLKDESEVKEIVTRNQEVINALKEFSKKISNEETNKRSDIRRKQSGKDDVKLEPYN